MGKLRVFIVIFLIIIVGFFLVFALLSFRNEKAVLDSNNQGQNSIGDNQETQSPEEGKGILEVISDFLGIGSEGESSEEGFTSSTTQDSVSTQAQISYSIKNFKQSSLCNQYQGTDCIDKTSDCSLLIENLDNQVTGIFEIKFTFSNPLNQELSSDILDYSISPGNNQTFASSFNIQGQEANQDISCSYTTLTIPEKII